jgi:H+/Cl- antiporter ClcA
LASAGFLAALAWVTQAQTNHPWLLFGLPPAGALIAWAYAGVGKSAAGGTNLLLDQLHAEDRTDLVPLRMFPLVLGATLLTHLVGGSAGREGTAVQMGGAIAAALARRLRLDLPDLRVLLMSGIAAGFAGVFGTPLAGTVFGMEILARGSIRYGALIPCLVAAFAADLTVRGLAIPHAHYEVAAPWPALALEPVLLAAVAGVAFGLVAAAFVRATGAVEHAAARLLPNPIWRTALGGGAIILATLALGTRAYNGLSLPLLDAAVAGAPVPTFAFLLKLGLTALTLGVGFKGGEVTPLFVIGATLGATLAGLLPMPPDALAALGFVAVFGAAANTPLACVLMGAELFGGDGVAYVGIAVLVAYTVSGGRGIYASQRALASGIGRASSPPV